VNFGLNFEVREFLENFLSVSMAAFAFMGESPISLSHPHTGDPSHAKQPPDARPRRWSFYFNE
jgi:hypothetical protein